MIEDPDITVLIKTKKVNIGMEDEPKYTMLDDYWDDATVDKVTELLREYQDLFPTKITDPKGIIRDLGMMRITLKPNVKPVKKRPYHLNPKYKEKVRIELDKMLTAGIIELVEESEWVSPMVVWENKKKGEIKICMDLRKLNDACVHDPFPTPFIDNNVNFETGTINSKRELWPKNPKKNHKNSAQNEKCVYWNDVFFLGVNFAAVLKMAVTTKFSTKFSCKI